MPPTSAYFDFMDVGMGACTFVRGPGGERILIDFGSTKNRNVGPPDAIEFMRPHIEPYDPSLHYLFLTHSDVDHYNQIDRLIESIANFKVDTVYYSGQEADYEKHAASLANLKKVTTNFNALVAGSNKSLADAPNFDFSGMKTWILSSNYPDDSTGDDPNPRSIVLCFKFGGRTVICGGDATSDTEAAIMLKNRMNLNDLECNILKAHHHGSETSSSPDWVKFTKPKALIVSADNNPGYKLPRRSVLLRYKTSLAATVKHPIVTWDDTSAVPAFRQEQLSILLLTTLAAENQGAQYQLEIRNDEFLQLLTTLDGVKWFGT